MSPLESRPGLVGREAPDPVRPRGKAQGGGPMTEPVTRGNRL